MKKWDELLNNLILKIGKLEKKYQETGEGETQNILSNLENNPFKSNLEKIKEVSTLIEGIKIFNQGYETDREYNLNGLKKGFDDYDEAKKKYLEFKKSTMNRLKLMNKSIFPTMNQ